MSPQKGKVTFGWPRREKSKVQKAVDFYLRKRVVPGAVVFLMVNSAALYGLWGKVTENIRNRVLAEATTIARNESHQDFKKEVARFRESIAEAITETRTRGKITEEILSSVLMDKIIPMIEELGTLKNRGDLLKDVVANLEKETEEFTADARSEIQSQIKLALEEMNEPKEQLSLLARQIDALEAEGLTVDDVQEGIRKLESFLVSIEGNEGADRLVSLEQRLRELIPIGSIIAWHPNVDKDKPRRLPDGWVQCNGGRIPEGPLKGLEIPNLNFVEGYASGRFLRGGSTSGKMQHATAHFDNSEDSRVASEDHWTYNASPEGDFERPAEVLGWEGLKKKTEDRRYEYSRPVNMSVVWIMRVK